MDTRVPVLPAALPSGGEHEPAPDASGYLRVTGPDALMICWKVLVGLVALVVDAAGGEQPVRDHTGVTRRRRRGHDLDALGPGFRVGHRPSAGPGSRLLTAG